MNTGEMVTSRRRPSYCDFGQAINRFGLAPSVPSFKGHSNAGPTGFPGHS
jgi:hypothetical protein